MSIHSTIKQQRQRLGLTEQQLADRVGVTRAAVQQWEREGGTAPKRLKQAAVAEALGISVAELMGIDAGAEAQSFEIDKKNPTDSILPPSPAAFESMGVTEFSRSALLLAKHFDMLKDETDRSVVYIESMNLIMKTLSDRLMQQKNHGDSEPSPSQYQPAPVEKLRA